MPDSWCGGRELLAASSHGPLPDKVDAENHQDFDDENGYQHQFARIALTNGDPIPKRTGKQTTHQAERGEGYFGWRLLRACHRTKVTFRLLTRAAQ